MLSLVKEVYNFVDSIERKIISRLPEVTITIYSILPRFTHTANFREFKTESSELKVPGVMYLNKTEVEKLPEFQALQNFLEENVFITSFLDGYMKIVDIHDLVRRLIPVIMQYYDWVYVNQSEKTHFDKMYLANFISAFLVFYSSILFRQHGLSFYFIKELAEHELKKKQEDATELNKPALKKAENAIKRWDDTLRKAQNHSHFENEIKDCTYERIFFLSGLTPEGTFRLFEQTYFLKHIKDFDYSKLKLVGYPRPQLNITISLGHFTKSLVFKRDIDPVILDWENIREIFLNKSSAYLQFKGTISPFQAIEVENNLYRILQLLKLYRFSTTRLTKGIIYPSFLKPIINELTFYAPYLEKSNYLVQIPITRPIRNKDGSSLRSFVQKNLRVVPGPYDNKITSLSIAIERYNEAMLLPFSFERNLSGISLLSETIFHIICGLDGLYKLSWTHKKDKKEERRKKTNLIAKLISNISYYDEKKVENDISNAYKDYRNYFAHGQEKSIKDSFFTEQLAFVIRLMDYLRLSILIRLNFNSEKDWKHFREKMFSESPKTYDFDVSPNQKEKDIDKKILEAYSKSIQQFLSKQTPYRYHEFEASLFKNKEFVKNFEKVLTMLADFLKKEKPNYFKNNSDKK